MILTLTTVSPEQLFNMTCITQNIKCFFRPIYLVSRKVPLQQNVLCKTTRLLKTSAIITAGLKHRDRAPTLMEFKKREKYMKEKGMWPENRRSSFAEWDFSVEIYAFGRRLGEEFNESLLREAFVDNSYITQEKERVKQLGMEDSISMKSNKDLSGSGKLFAKDFIASYLRSYWSLLPEEGIETVTEYLTSDNILSKIGLGIGIKDLIMTQESPPTISTCATCFSAIIGALYLSSGKERTYKFIQDFILTQLVDKDIWDIWQIDDPMDMLKYILKGNGRGDPEPRLIGDIGKLTLEATFYVGIYSDKKLLGKGYGETTDMAIHMAALNSLSQFFNQTQNKDPLPVLQSSEFVLKSLPNKPFTEWKMPSNLSL